MSAAKRVFTQMWEDKRVRRGVFWLLLAAIAVLMFLLNLRTPLMMDDYDYSFSWSTGERLAGISDIVKSQAAHYMLWGGRSVVHALAQLFLYLGKPVFNAANALMYALLLLEICALARRKDTAWDWRMLLIAHSLLFFTVSFFGVSFLWLDGACNYLWGTALALLPLLIARSEREGGFFDAGFSRGVLALPISFLAGWTNENTACGVLAAMLLLFGYDWLRGRRLRAWRAAALLMQALGVAVMLLAPGNFARAAQESTRGFIMEMIYRVAVVSYCLLRYAGVALVIGLLLFVPSFRRRGALRWELALLLGASAVLSAYALVGSPQISDRSFTGVIVLAIALLLSVFGDLAPAMRPRGAAVFALLAVLCAGGGVLALGDVAAHEEKWLAQESAILSAAEQGMDEVTVSGVPSQSRYTMSIALEQDAALWPNSTMSKYYGVRIAGK